MSTHEQGQSIASYNALNAYGITSDATSNAKSVIRHLQSEMKQAKAALRDAEAAEQAAMDAYLAIPFSDDEVA